MSTTPTEPIDPEANEPTQSEMIRIRALEFASMTSSRETPIKEFLQKANRIEKFITTGDVGRE